MKLKLDLNRPHQLYHNAAGKRLVGVTTVTGVMSKEALLPWYASMEREGVLAALKTYAGTRGDELLCTDDDVKAFSATLPANVDGEPIWYATMKRDRSASIGSIAHALAEAFLRNMEFDEEGHDLEMVRLALIAFNRFREWWSNEGLMVVASELQMVSERDQVGGTLDIMARSADGRLVLADLKTAKRSRYYPYPETYAQVAQYASMYEETRGEPVSRIVIARIGNAENDPGDTYWLTDAQRAAGKRMFDAARIIYEMRKELSR